MTIINEHFDELEFWDSARFGNPVIKDTEIIIPVHQIRVYQEHPLNNTNEPILLPKAKQIFSGVQKSERQIAEYLGDPKSGDGFKPSYKITDSHFVTTDKLGEIFVLEGILEEPLSWITWEIESVAFFLEI
ncbi:MAG: hypothetical protein Fur006_67240 [Coleofasciculaceae cyanobacterium]